MNLSNNKYYKMALEYIARTDLNALEPGKHFIDGDNLFVNIVDSNMKTPEAARLEVHNEYIDIQVPLSKPETFGVKPRTACVNPDGEYNPVKDILFFTDKDWQEITVYEGQPITFDPDMGHAPLIGEGTIHKAIFKVKVVR